MESVQGAQPKAIGVEGTFLANMRMKIYTGGKKILLDHGWLYVFVGFLLGRAIILSVVSPFAVAFLATLWFMHKDKAAKTLLATMAGAFTISLSHGLFVGIACFFFIIISAIFKNVKGQQTKIPIFVFLATVGPRIFLYSINGQLTSYEWMLIFVEGILGTVLVLIFMQSVPLLSQKRYRPTLKNEEIVCMIILIASILTGTAGWEVDGAQLE